MSEILPVLMVIRSELQGLKAALAKMTKTHTQRLVEEWLRKDQVIKTLRCSARTLDHLISSGMLPYSKINGLIYIKSSSIEKMLIDHCVDHSSAFVPSTFYTTKND